MITQADLKNAKSIIYEAMVPTLQQAWPLLSEATGTECWVKHENQTPIGAFKVRGGLVHMRRRVERGNRDAVITATRGNHGQSIPYAARREGIDTVIVVPNGNSTEKNAAMKALGAELVETGADFDEAREAMMVMADERGLDTVPSFHADLVAGVATYAAELFDAAGELDAVYVPIGMGSGICGVISVRDLLGLKTEVIGVVSDEAQSYRLSFDAGRAIETNSSNTFADGMAVRVPHPDALDVIMRGASRIVSVSDDEIADAVRLYYRACHNLAEGAGAASLAALMKERDTTAGKRVGVILSGGNIDTDKFARILSGGTPEA